MLSAAALMRTWMSHRLGTQIAIVAIINAKSEAIDLFEIFLLSHEETGCIATARAKAHARTEKNGLTTTAHR